MAGFIFGGDTGMSYEALQRKRKITDALMQQKNKPMDVANGLAQGLSSVAGALLGKRLDKREDQMRSDRQGEFTDMFGGGMGATPASYGGPTQTVAAAMGGGGDMTAYRDAIASIESAGSGDYSAVGPKNSKLGRALGRYQIMEANIAPWSREALGREVSADEFLANPKLQDAIFDKKFGGYVQQFGPEGAAQAWFAGPGGVGKTGRKDVLGTSVGQYGQKFTKAMGGAPSGSGGQSRNPANLAQLAQFAADPLLDPAQRKIAEIMLQREMQQGDPMTQLDMQYKQAQIDKMNNPAPAKRETAKGADGYLYYTDDQSRVLPGVVAESGGGTEYGLTPQYATDAEGNLSMVQLGKDGTAKKVDLPEGMALQKGVEKLDLGTSFQWYNTVTGEAIGEPIPKDNRGAAAESAAGRVEGEAEAQAKLDAPSAVSKAGETISLIDQVLNDPALPSVVGKIQGRMDPEGITGLAMGQDALNLMPKIEQLQGQAFLQAFEGLKGGGQITEREGAAATAAITRLGKRYVDEATYKEALTDLRRLSENAQKRAAGQDVPEYIPQWFEGGGRAGQDDPTGGAADYSQATMDDLLSADINSMTPEQEDAWEQRMLALQGGK